MRRQGAAGADYNSDSSHPYSDNAGGGFGDNRNQKTSYDLPGKCWDSSDDEYSRQTIF